MNTDDKILLAFGPTGGGCLMGSAFPATGSDPFNPFVVWGIGLILSVLSWWLLAHSK